MALAKLKNINRSLHIKVDEQRKILDSKKTNIEKLQLNYENLLYKKQHLKREIQICQNLSTPNLDEIEKERKEDITLKQFDETLWEVHHPRSLAMLEEEKQLRLSDIETSKTVEQKLSEYQDVHDKKRKFVEELPMQLTNMKKFLTDMKTNFITIQPNVTRKEQVAGTSSTEGDAEMEVVEEEEEREDLGRSRMYEEDEREQDQDQDNHLVKEEGEGMEREEEGEIEVEGLGIEEEVVITEQTNTNSSDNL